MPCGPDGQPQDPRPKNPLSTWLSTLSFGASAVPLLQPMQQGTGAMWLLRSGQVLAWMLHLKRLLICALPFGKPLLLWAAASHGCSSHWTIYTQGRLMCPCCCSGSTAPTRDPESSLL